MATYVFATKYLCCQNCFSENRAKDFSLYERSRSGETLWLPILLGIFVIVGSLAAVLFFMNLKKER